MDRSADGRFRPGTSGNPAGRRRGATNKALTMARAAAERVALPLLIEAAEGGDVDAAKAICSLGVPKVRPVALAQPIPSSVDGILAAMSAGALDVSTATDALGAHLVAARVCELEELRQRVDDLAAVVADMTGKRS